MSQGTGAPSIGFIGAGRLGAALARALSDAGHTVAAVWSRSPTRGDALAQSIKGCAAADKPERVLERAQLIFMAVPDDAIAAVASQLPWRGDHGAVHCSGALGLDVLQGAAQHGARIGSFHPLQLFTDSMDARHAFDDCAVAIEAPAGLHSQLESLARDLRAHPIRVPSNARAAYHAASHYAAAFLCVLMAEGQAIFERIGIPGTDAARALLVLARGTLDAVERDGPARAMAGVYSRGDEGTAARHLRALDRLGPELLALYRPLALGSVALGAESGRLPADVAQRMRALLQA